MKTQDNNSESTNDQSCLSAVSSSDIYWIINQNTYNVDGVEVPKGRMVKMNKKTDRPIQNKDWRKATVLEVETKQYYKGNYFNLSGV